jgi:hypothetical protein
MVYSHIEEWRQYICWFIHKLFQVDLKRVMEVYIDSTHRANVNKAELYAIVAEEGGTGVPIGYMLMEKKPTKDSRTYPGEVTNCCANFLLYARNLGLSPRIVHTDKIEAELAAIKVSSCSGSPLNRC